MKLLDRVHNTIAGRGRVRAHARLLGPLIALFLALPIEFSNARTVAIGTFRSVCVAVQFEPYLSGGEVAAGANVEKDVAEHARQRFAAKGLKYPIDHGVGCYPGKVERGTGQLAVVFHVTVKSNPVNSAETLGAVILHIQFEDQPRASHEYPTELFACQNRTELHACIKPQIVRYFDVHLFPLIENDEEQRGGSRK